MKQEYAQLLLLEASKLSNAAAVFSLETGELTTAEPKLLNAIGSFNAVMHAAATPHDQAHITAAEAYRADELLSEGPEGYNNKCKDHEWVSADNAHVSGIEICKTCLDAGEKNVPIREAQGG